MVPPEPLPNPRSRSRFLPDFTRDLNPFPRTASPGRVALSRIVTPDGLDGYLTIRR